MISRPVRNILLALILLVGVQLACGGGRQNDQPEATQPPAGQGDAPASPVGDGYLFHDDFQQGNANAWNITTAWYVVQDGDSYVFSADGAGAAWVPGGHTWGEYVYRVNTRLDQGSLVLSFHVSQSGRYLLHIRSDGLFLVKEQPVGEYTTLAQTGPFPTAGWHYLAMGSQGGHIQVYVDRILWMDVTDGSPLPNGTIGVSTPSGSRGTVDDVLVTALRNPLPSGVVQAPAAVANAAAPEPPSDLNLGDVDLGNEPPPAPEVEAVSPTVSFLVEGDPSASISAGECITVEWSVFDAMAVFFRDAPVAMQEFFDDCPGTDTTYALEVVAFDGSTSEHTVSVSVSGASQSGKPDLIVTSAYFEPDPVISGERFTAHYAIQNQGNVDSGAFTLRWHFSPGTGLVDCNKDFDGLGAGQAAWGTCTLTTNAPAGWSSTTLTVDVEGEIAESDEGNNVASPTLFVEGGAQGGQPEAGEPELHISGVEINPSSPETGQAVTVTVTIYNGGDGNAGAFNVIWQPQASFIGCSWDVAGLAAGAGDTLTCSYEGYPFAALHLWRAEIDVDGEVGESIETNNTMQGEVKVNDP